MTDAIVVAAHPDDEVLGASTVLASQTCTVVFATDGVPPKFWRQAGTRQP